MKNMNKGKTDKFAEKIFKKELKQIQKENSSLKDVLKGVGLIYSLALGGATVGAVGGLIYSLCTGDGTPWKDAGLSAISLQSLEYVGIMLYGLTPQTRGYELND